MGVNNKKLISFFIAVMTGILLAAGVLGVFGPQIRHSENVMHESQILYDGQSELLRRKAEIQKQWEDKKQFFEGDKGSPDLLLAQWTKSLLQHSQANAVTFEKIEPLSRVKESGAECQILIAFTGNIKQLTGFLHYLAKKEPLVSLDSLNIRRNDNAVQFSYEILLSKVIL